MKNTVKLEQFVALKEKDLQKIKGCLLYTS
ncbi:competence-stimulating peptide ComC, partial [Streptococcus pneumoniae]